MALYFALRTTPGQSIGYCEIRRVDPPVPPHHIGESEVCTYEVEVHYYGPPPRRHDTVVRHRFGDGAWALVARAMAAALELDNPLDTELRPGRCPFCASVLVEDDPVAEVGWQFVCQKLHRFSLHA